MAIIKAGKLIGKRGSQGESVFNLTDVSQQANLYLDSIRQQAAEVIAAAHGEADQIRAQARQQGVQEALEQAREDVRQELEAHLQTLLPALEQAVEAIQQSRRECQRHWQANVVHLATRIAARVIRTEVSQHPEITSRWIEEALALAVGSTQIRLHLNPDDHAAIQGEVEQWVSQISNVEPTEIIPDAAVEQGTCRVTTEFGEIDQRIDSQLARIEQELA